MSTPLPEHRGPALVTGASRGIGRAVALALARSGHPVAVNYRVGVEAAAEVTAQIQEAGGRAVLVQADMADPRQAEAAVREATERLGGLEVLVNNAGITRDRLLLQMSEPDWHATWDTDLVGPRAAARAAIPAMAAAQAGRIINVSSVVGATGNAGQANYAAAKSAILGFTRQLAVEHARDGITVNCVIPGLIDTDAVSHLDDEQWGVWLRRIPMGRSASPEEAAGVITFFASPAAAYVTGQCISVDGGLLAAAGQGFAS